MNKLKEDIMRLSSQVRERKEHVTNEEMTKQSLIIPFLQVLGYDVFNPLEIRPEYTADFGKKKGEKVDYAIFKNGIPIIFIEAKSVQETTSNHSGQLSRYFNATPGVRVGVITNGIEYNFFTDMNKSNIMDENYFYKFDITNPSDSDIEILSCFCKESFETEVIVKYAEELTYTTNLNKKLREIFKNPPDDFIRYLIKDFSDTRITSNVLERFRPIVKKSISQALLELVSQSLQKESEPIAQPDSLEEDIKEDEPEKIKKSLITTEEELQCFKVVKEIIMSAKRDISSLDYKDTTNYLGVHIKNTNSWFIRFYLGNKKMIIARITPEKAKTLVGAYKLEAASKGHGDSSRIYIESPNDLYKLKDLIIACYDSVIE